jgi:hypothetical protein
VTEPRALRALDRGLERDEGANPTSLPARISATSTLPLLLVLASIALVSAPLVGASTTAPSAPPIVSSPPPARISKPVGPGLQTQPYDVDEIVRLHWREGARLEEGGHLLASSAHYSEIARLLGTSAPAAPFWRLSRNYWRYGEELPVAAKEDRIHFFSLADEVAGRGIEVDPECAECMLWKFASLGRLATTRGVVSAVRDAPVMADLLDRGIALQPSHSDGENNSTLGNLYYASATFHRMVPDWFFLKWIMGVRGDKERAIRDARSAVAISSQRVDYQMELGAALLCYGTQKNQPHATAEGMDVLKRALDLPVFLATDHTDKELGRILIVEPDKACGFSRDGFIDVEAAGRQL